MKKAFSLILPLSLMGSLVCAPALADTRQADYVDHASPEEATGFFSGAIVGALAGGPPGAIVGAAIGAFAGDGHRARNEVNELQTELYTAQLETRRLRDESRELEREYQLAMAELDRLRQSGPRSMPAYLPATDAEPCCDNTVMALHFRSGSSEIESQYQEQLEGLVNLARQMPNPTLEITGYADRNGDAEANLHLSRQRSEAVQAFFNSQGIDNSSIITVGYGESQPLHSAQSLETDFFDRRVSVRLRDNSKSMLTQSPDGE
mgnify:CR=1 FL=1|jgi:sortase system peptidoglycan-associated protein